MLAGPACGAPWDGLVLSSPNGFPGKTVPLEHFWPAVERLDGRVDTEYGAGRGVPNGWEGLLGMSAEMLGIWERQPGVLLGELCCAVLLPGAVGKPRAAARGLLRGSRGEKQKDPFGQRGLLRPLAGLG